MARLLITAVLALLVAAPVADAATARRVGPIVGQWSSDGEHTVAYSPTAGALELVHTNGDTVDGSIPAGCSMVDVNRSTVLFGCPPAHPDEAQGPHVPVLFDSDAGTYSWPAGLTPDSVFVQAPPGGRAWLGALGSKWISGSSESGDAHSTSQLVYIARTPAASPITVATGANQIVDLDRASGTRQICKPLSIPWVAGSDEPYDNGYRIAFRYAKPWLLLYEAKGPPTLHRCGSKRAEKIVCGPCTDLSLAGPWLAWVDAGTLVVRDLRKNRTRRWSIPGATVARITSFILTRDAALLAVKPPPRVGIPEVPGTLYRVDLR